MEEQKSDDWLPAGWTVEVKVRKNGKRDKFYTAPSGELKFNSKVEVSRYLDAEQIKFAESERKKNDKGNLSARIAVVDDVTVEGLPPGWIKEIRVRKKAHAIRRDPYYTDPVSGYVFRSMKDVLRYLKTGEVGKLALKPKEGGETDLNPEYDKVLAHPVVKDEDSTVRGTSIEVVTDQTLESNGTIQDMHIFESACLGESKLSQRSSDQCVEGTEPNNLNMPEAKDLEQLEGKVEFSESNSALGPAVEAFPEKKPSEDMGHMIVRHVKSKGRKESNLPRRSSKRLAGVELDSTPELKTCNRNRKNTTRLVGEAEASPAKGYSLGSQGPDQLQAEPEANFTFNTSNSAEELLKSNNLKNLFGDLENSEKHATDNKVAENQEIIPDLFPGNQSPVQQVELAETENTTEAMPGGSPLVLPFGDSWSDPCIEFAVKTLTGEIDLDIQDYFNHQINSSQGNSSLQFPNFGIDNSCQTHLWSQQLDTTDKPTLPCTGHERLQDSGRESTEPKSLNVSEAKDSEQIKRKFEFSESTSSLGPAVEALPEIKPPEDMGSVVVRRGKSKGKKEPNLARRSSKRLNGVELGPTPELKSSNQSRKKITRSSGKAEASPVEGFSLGNLEPCQLQADLEENCNFNASKSIEELLQSNNCKNLSGDMANSANHDGDAETDNKVAENQARIPDLSPGNRPPVQQVEMAEAKNTTDAAPGGSLLVFPFGDSWPDPCIEFAVKTLTGAFDLDIQDYFNHQINSSQGNSSLQFPNFGLDTSCHTDLWSQQFDTDDKPTLPRAGHESLQNSDGSPPEWIKERCERSLVISEEARYSLSISFYVLLCDYFYYTDPVSRYALDSMKDDLCCLNTGELERFVFKPKDGGSSDLKSEFVRSLSNVQNQLAAEPE